MSDQALTIGIGETGPRGMIAFRADMAGAGVAEAVRAATGADLPKALRAAGTPDGGAIWFSTDEYLLFVPRDKVADRIAGLEAALPGVAHMAEDVSDARTVLRLTGPRVGEVLAKGAPCDCSDRGFPPGTARRTHLAGLAVAIWRLDTGTWEIACFRSFSHHLTGWLAVAGRADAAVDVF